LAIIVPKTIKSYYKNNFDCFLRQGVYRLLYSHFHDATSVYVIPWGRCCKSSRICIGSDCQAPAWISSHQTCSHHCKRKITFLCVQCRFVLETLISQLQSVEDN